MDTKKKVKKGIRKAPLEKPARKTQRKENGKTLHIVGIGASAGGLEALDQFLKPVSPGEGLAYVIVQHLDPTHKGAMPELLQRMTSLKVVEVENRTPVRPDTVYMIPPNKDMSILHGVLLLLEPGSPRGLRLPIDFFFRALAHDQQERSTGIILSGMGTDGTLGIKAIKEKGGIVLAQDPATAQFDGMPRSAIDTGLADYIAPPQDLFAKLIGFLHFPPSLPPAKEPSEPLLDGKSKSAQEKIFFLLRSQTGHDFSFYKKGTVHRRIERRMSVHQISNIDQYVKLLQANPHEREILFKELLIGVTNFFRDPQAWEQLKDEVIPELIASRPEGGMLRAWVAGCSTGEEAYSLAIVFKEAMEKVKPQARFTLQIYATDLDRDAIDKARMGVYPANITADVSPERLKRFFIKEDNDTYRVAKEIRETVVLATQNIIMDPPFTKLDIIICRNLMIYLVAEMQKKLLPMFHYCLNPGGILFLGNAETTGSSSDLFTPLEGRWRIYLRSDVPMRAGLVDFPSSFFPSHAKSYLEKEPPKPSANLQQLVDKLMLEQFSPPAVLVNNKGDILYISGRTGKYLEPAAGKANWNVFAMAREGIRYDLTLAFRKVVSEKGHAEAHGLTLTANGLNQLVDLTVRHIETPEDLKGMYIIVFQDAKATADRKLPPHPPRRGRSLADARIAELEQENKRMAEDLQKNREEMQTSQEELKGTNEELQSTNEELQSSNEELTTSKEEMQSLNEELQTVNAELQSKVEELSHSNNDMKNLLNSTDIATVFLDKNLNLQRFTTQMTRILKLKQRDLGRPITDISSDLVYNEMVDDVHQVLQMLVFVEKQIITHDGRWFTVRIMPYRTLEDKIDGVVITFADITIAKKLELELRRAKGELEKGAEESAVDLAQAKEDLQTERTKKKDE